MTPAARITVLVAALVAAATNACTCGTNDAPKDDLPYEVPFQLGPTDLAPGDAITIEGIRGTRPTLEAGGRYVVRGRFTLASAATATLLVSVTRLGPFEEGMLSTGGSLYTRRGEGTFALPLHLYSPGHTHLSFYDAATHRPLSKVYFGDGPWLRPQR